MIGEAVETVITLGWAFLVWIVLLAATATLALWTVIVTAAWACHAAWRGVTAVVALVQHSEAPASPPEPHKPSQPRPRPSWAHTEQDAA